MRDLNASTIPAPVRPTTILQFGGGNFLRAFVDQMVQVANDAGVMNTGVAIVHATSHDDPALDLLVAQDGRYHVLLEGIANGEPVREFTLVNSITAIVRAHANFAAYRDLYLSPDLTMIASNTTEAGIAWVAGDDLTAQPPVSFPAKIAALLFDRWQHFDGAADKGLRIVCCELIEDNGSTLRQYVLRHAAAARLPAKFVTWVEQSCSFHDTLVDRIVPGYPHDEIDAIQTEIDFHDQVVVKGERFGIWAIADASPAVVSTRRSSLAPTQPPAHSGWLSRERSDRVETTTVPPLRDLLPLDRAGLPVEFMTDIRPFRAKKVKILNGLHTAMAQVGLLAGCESVREAVTHPAIASYLQCLLADEILPSIPDYWAGDESRAELVAFAAKITERFDNPFLHHRLADISLNSISKWQARNLPVALDCWKNSEDSPLTTFAFAALAVLYSGQGADSQAVRATGWEPRDDEAPLTALRMPFDTADDSSIVAWIRHVIDAAGFFPDEAELPPMDADLLWPVASERSDSPHASYLANTAARHVRAILDHGIAAALTALTT